MADQQIGNPNGFAAVHAGSGTQKSNLNGSDTSPSNAFGDTNANYGSIANMKARLTTINSTYFTAARLNTMTENDLRYAVRMADAPASIK